MVVDAKIYKFRTPPRTARRGVYRDRTPYVRMIDNENPISSSGAHIAELQEETEKLNFSSGGPCNRKVPESVRRVRMRIVKKMQLTRNDSRARPYGKDPVGLSSCWY